MVECSAPYLCDLHTLRVLTGQGTAHTRRKTLTPPWAKSPLPSRAATKVKADANADANRHSTATDRCRPLRDVGVQFSARRNGPARAHALVRTRWANPVG